MHRTLILTRRQVILTQNTLQSLLVSSSSLMVRHPPKHTTITCSSDSIRTVSNVTHHHHRSILQNHTNHRLSPTCITKSRATNQKYSSTHIKHHPLNTTSTGIRLSILLSSSSSFVTTTIPPPTQCHSNTQHWSYPSQKEQQQQRYNPYHVGVRLDHRYFSTTPPPPPPPSDDHDDHKNNYHIKEEHSAEMNSTTVSASEDSTNPDTITMNTADDETTTNDHHTDPTSTEAPEQHTPTPEEADEQRRKLARLAKEYGVNLPGYEDDAVSPDNKDDDDDSPPGDDDEGMYGKMGNMMNQDTSQHRSTNIGVPARPEDPVVVDGKTVRVMFCYSKYEIMEGTRFEDHVGQFDLPLTYDAIVKEACEFYNEEVTEEYFSLEYFHQRRWHPLSENCYDILLHYHKEQILHQEDYQTLFFLRMPFMYDTSDYADEDPTGGLGDFNSLTDAAMGNLKDGKLPNPPPTLQDKIIQTIQELKKKKVLRDPDSPSPYDLQADIMKYQLIIPHSFMDNDAYPDEEEEDPDEHPPILVSTRNYVLDGCRTDYDLRDILLLNVNAMSHIVRCIHYDIYWNFPLPKRQDIDPSEQEDDDAPPTTTNHDKNEQEEDSKYDGHPHYHPHHHSHEHSADCRH